MEVIRDNGGKVTKVIITEKEYAETHKDFKGKHDGKRTWIAPFDVSEMTMQLTEGINLEIIDDPNEKKFWCHYFGSNGNKPVRRRVWLTKLNKLIPAIGDNELCETPLWYENVDDVVYIYAQLGDEVAVLTDCELYERQLKLMNTTDADFDAQLQVRIKNVIEDKTIVRTQERIDKSCEHLKEYFENEKKYRNEQLVNVRMMQNYTKVLLDGAWVSACAINAYEEVNSPYLPVLKELRRLAMEKREQQYREYKERELQREEEEKRKEAEEEAKEQQRLTEEAKKLKNGDQISGADVVELCKRYGIKVHPRTAHNLLEEVGVINEAVATFSQYHGKRKPNLYGCFEPVKKLREYLLNNNI